MPSVTHVPSFESEQPSEPDVILKRFSGGGGGDGAALEMEEYAALTRCGSTEAKADHWVTIPSWTAGGL